MPKSRFSLITFAFNLPQCFSANRVKSNTSNDHTFSDILLPLKLFSLKDDSVDSVDVHRPVECLVEGEAAMKSSLKI